MNDEVKKKIEEALDSLYIGEVYVSIGEIENRVCGKGEVVEKLSTLYTEMVEVGVKDFASGLIDQLETGTIVDQYNEETGELSEEADTKLVSDVLHTTAVQIVKMYLEDYLIERKDRH